MASLRSKHDAACRGDTRKETPLAAARRYVHEFEQRVARQEQVVAEHGRGSGEERHLQQERVLAHFRTGLKLAREHLQDELRQAEQGLKTRLPLAPLRPSRPSRDQPGPSPSRDGEL